jgi:hypothetical protein
MRRVSCQYHVKRFLHINEINTLKGRLLPIKLKFDTCFTAELNKDSRSELLTIKEQYLVVEMSSSERLKLGGRK